MNPDLHSMLRSSAIPLEIRRSNMICYSLFPLLILIQLNPSSAPPNWRDQEQIWIQRSLAGAKSLDASKATSTMRLVNGTLADRGRFDEALKLAAEQDDMGRRHEFLMDIASAQARHGHVNKALSIAGQIPLESGRETSFMWIAVACADRGDIVNATMIMKDLSQSFNRSLALNAIAIALAREGKFEEAALLVNDISEAYQKKETAEAIRNLRDGTKRPLDRIQGALRDQISVLIAFSRPGTYDDAILAVAAGQNGDVEAVNQFVTQAIKNSKTPDIPARGIITSILATTAVAELGQSERAAKLILAVHAASERDWSGLTSTFGTPILLSLLCKLHLDSELDTLLRRLREKSDDPSDYHLALMVVSQSFVEHGRMSELEEFYAKLKTAEERVHFSVGVLSGIEYAQQAEE